MAHATGPPRRSTTGTIVVIIIVGAFLLLARTVSVTALASHRNAASEQALHVPPHPVIKLADHPFTAPGNRATSTDCDLPPFSTTVAGQDALYRALLPCLMRAWSPALRRADMPIQPPSVVTSGTDVDTPCGIRHWDDTNLYCPDDNTIYMMALHYSEVEERTDRGTYLGQFAHEFGHALQNMTGLFEAKDDALESAGGAATAAGLDVTRRTELQATCFEGMALSALDISRTDILGALWDSERRGDEYNKQPDHGTVAINKVWVDRGFTQNRTSMCDTWSASAGDVR